MFVIMSASRQYLTGDWNEDAPVWSSKLQDAYDFKSRAEALDTMQRHIQADIAAKRTPGFTGSRVADLKSERERLVMNELRAQGYRATFNDDCSAIWIDFDETKTSIAKALATFPRRIYDLPVFLRARGKPIKWDHKSA